MRMDEKPDFNPEHIMEAMELLRDSLGGDGIASPSRFQVSFRTSQDGNTTAHVYLPNGRIGEDTDGPVCFTARHDGYAESGRGEEYEYTGEAWIPPNAFEDPRND